MLSELSDGLDRISALLEIISTLPNIISERLDGPFQPFRNKVRKGADHFRKGEDHFQKGADPLGL